MRIAQLANFVGPTSGGMRTAVTALGHGYRDLGARRLLIVPGPTDAREDDDAGTIVRLRAPQVGGGYRLIVEPWRITEALEAFAPTALEFHDKATLLPVSRWARRRGVPTTLVSHERLDDMLALRTGLVLGSRASIAVLNRMLVRSVDRVVVTSRYAEAEFRSSARGAGCPVVRVPLGVDLQRFAPGAWTPSPLLRLVHVGRLSREKSPHLAVATAVELHRRGVPVRLDVYGTGPHRDELVDLAGDAPVRFHGHLDDRAELARRIAEADIALSVCPGETFGLAVLEALACGTPVLTADRGGARELIDRTCGGWAAPDPTALADGALALAARLSPLLREAARLRAQAYPWSATAAHLLELHAAAVAAADTAA